MSCGVHADFFYINNGLTALGLSPFPSTTVSPPQPLHAAVLCIGADYCNIASSACTGSEDLCGQSPAKESKAVMLFLMQGWTCCVKALGDAGSECPMPNPQWVS